jgi:hypothetical protein
VRESFLDQLVADRNIPALDHHQFPPMLVEALQPVRDHVERALIEQRAKPVG